MRRERGMTFLSLVFILAVVAFFALLGFRMMPAYVEYFTVQRIITDLVNSPELKGASIREVQNAFDRRAVIDYISAVKGTDLQVDKNKDGISISASWEHKVPLVYNISALIEFEVEK
jgi:hypothetical protein